MFGGGFRGFEGFGFGGGE
jgi:DnaJ homolog subfamily A member 2